MGKDRLSEEFRQDPSFVEIVCSLISSNAEERQVSIIIDTLNRVINPQDFIVDTLVAAILMACGHTKQGENLLKLIVGSALFLLVADFIYDNIKDKGKRKRVRKSRKNM